MRFTFSVRSSARRTLVRACIAVAPFALSALALGAEPSTTPCTLGAPKYQTKGGAALFEISIDCESKQVGAKPFPMGTDLLVGLTLYAASDVKVQPRSGERHFVRRVLQATPEIAADLKGSVQSKSAVAFGQPRWIVLADEDADSYDVSAKVVRIDKPGSKRTLQFQVDEKAIAGKQHLLFAVWRAADRNACDKQSKYARSGCKRDGYVLGDGGVSPIASYPGLEVSEFEHPSGDAWTSERWIAERFR